MYSSQGIKAIWSWSLRHWSEALPGLRNLSDVGWIVVSMLRLQIENKTAQFEI
jgi:hypothetical protein